MKTPAAAVALVESPAQLLNVIEWAYASRSAVPGRPVGAGMSIMVLPPPEPAARVQLDRMAELARSCGFAVSWQEVRGGRGVATRALRVIRSQVAKATTLVLGDPFSGFLQLVVGLSRAEQVVVVDDGSASIEFVEVVADGRPLTRWHRVDDQSTVGRLVASRASRRMVPDHGTLRARRPLRLFTAMPVSSDRVRIDRNDLRWTRQQFGPPRLLPGADLVGSSLTETGVIDEGPYLQAIGVLAAKYRIGRYLAHRRESNDKLSKISDLGLTVVRPDLPLELYARIGPIAERVISFPSTVIHTLPLALADTSVEVLVCDLDQQWFAVGRRAGRSGTFLTSMTDSARRTHGLNAIAGTA